MDLTIVIFTLGTSVSFGAFYWASSRWLAVAETRRRADRARRAGFRKMCFLDNLRHEAGLRAQAVIRAAADQATRGASETGIASLDAEMLERLGETCAMLQPLLSREFIADFDRLVRTLHTSSPSRGTELSAALDRLARQAVEIATAPRYESAPTRAQRWFLPKRSSTQTAVMSHE